MSTAERSVEERASMATAFLVAFFASAMEEYTLTAAGLAWRSSL